MRHKIQPNVIISLQLDDTTTHYLISEDIGRVEDPSLIAMGLESLVLSMQNPVVLAIMELDGQHKFSILSPRGNEINYQLLAVDTIEEFTLKYQLQEKTRRLIKK